MGGVRGLDGTPMLDIRPAMRRLQPRGDLRRPGWSSQLTAAYRAKR